MAAIAGQNVEDVYGLSPLQEGILFHCLYGADDTLYVTTFACTLNGLDVAAFELAWARAIERHPALRTAFAWAGLRQPVQIVGRRVKAVWREEDWRGLEPEALEARWEAVLAAEPKQLHKLTRAPLLRLSLFRCGVAEHRFVFSHHHLILDGWSLPLLLGEVFTSYEDERAGRGASLPPARPYRDFIAWLKRQDLGAAEAYWRRSLRGFTASSALGVDRGTAGSPVEEVGAREIRLPAPEVETVRAFARVSGLTLNTLVQGAWALALSRGSGHDDVVYGVSVAGRPPELAGVERMLGVFTNTLPLRAQADPATPAGTWLQRLQESQAEMRRHEHSPLSQVQKWSEVPAGQPLFENILVFENYPLERGLVAGRDGLTLSDVRAHLKTSSPLLVTVKPADGLSLVIAYDRGRFDAAAVVRLQQHWRMLLTELARDERRPLGDLPLWSPAERHQLLVEWNDTAAAGPLAPLHLGFLAQASRTPQAEALAAGGVRLTYGELRAQSEVLAGCLRELGVGPEERVAVCLERSVALVVALLGTLAAGGAYVPLDPAYPRQRLVGMLQDSQAAVLVTEERLADLLAPALEGVRVLLVDSATGEPAARALKSPASPRPAAVEAGLGNLAYLIYTSGSTGRPKGVAIEHRNAAALVRWARGVFAPEELAGVLFATSVCFDLSVFELFVPLTAGGRVILADNALALPTLPEAGEVTLVNTVPSAMEELVRSDRLPPAVRVVNLAGEALKRALVDRIYARSRGVRVRNLYGPSEDTTYSTFALQERGESGAPAIGRPIAGTRAYVVDRAGRPAPAGVAGELLLGGEGLARGYFGRPDLTAGRFIPDLFSGEPGARLYRTGDLVWQRPGGELEFRGRLDQQVKIRGFRIEPGEIEAVLMEHPAVAAAAVVPRQGPDGRSRLIAYVVTGTAAAVAGDLRRFLGERLPEHMLPAGFAFLEALPLTASGKVDRGALPAFEGSRSDLESAFTPARNAVEEALAAVWAKVLGVGQVGVHDSFFDLGGDSILSLQVVTRAREAGLRITPQQIFERRTIAALAAVAGREETAAPRRQPAAGPVPLTPIQQRFLAARPPEAHWFNQALFLEGIEPLAPARLAAAVARVAAHHEALRLRFEEQDGGWRQATAGAQGGAAFAVVDLAALPEAACRGALESASRWIQGSLCLERGPLLRAVLLPQPPGRGDRLLLVAHHLVVDGVSWRILLEDLATAYRDPGRPLPTGSPFQEWAQHLAAQVRSAETRGELAFWRQRVPISLRPLPVDFPGEDNTAGAARAVVVSLDAGETEALLREVPEACRARIDETLLAALALAFSAWTGEEDLWVELEGHGREEIAAGLDLSRTVGWLTAIYPVHLPAPRNGAAGEVLRGVKEELRGIPRRGLGYGLLRGLGEDGGLPSHPLPQVVFNYLGQLDRGLAEGSPFRLAPEDAGLPASPRQTRWHQLEINAGVRDGRLRLSFIYSARLHRAETVQSLAAGYLDALRRLIRSAGRESWTPSDFPLLRLGPQEARSLLRELPEDAEDVYPLSPMQRGMHFHTLLEPQSGVYFTQTSCELEGALDAAALRRSWERTVDRHAALRTSFLWQGREEPLQVVHRRIVLPWVEHDWRAEDPAAIEERFARFLDADRAAGFDLSRPPLLRCALIRVAEAGWRFVWSVHHLLIDGWCQSLLFGEVFARYSAALRGQEVALPPAPRYRDYVAWLSRQDLAGAEEHWRRELRGLSSPTPLGIDRSPARRDGRDPGYQQREAALPASVSAALAAMARRNDLTISTVLTGLWALLLSRLSGENDVLFGTAVSGRPAELPGAEVTVGLFLNTLPVRVPVREDELLLPWLAALQERQMEARRHEHTPLVEVQGWSEVPRGRPLFDSLLVVENYPVDPAVAAGLASEGGSGLRVRGVRSFDRVSYPLTVQVLPGEPLLLRLKFETDRFALPWIEETLRQLAGLCRQAAAEPGRPLAAFSLLTPETPLPDPREPLPEPRQTPVPERVREVASRWPGHAAVRRGERQWSYAELTARSDDLARELRRRGLVRGEVVAVQGEGGFGLIAALLGVLAAGGVLLALDRHLPAQRRRLMLSEAGARRVLAIGSVSTEDLADAGERLAVDAESGRLAVIPAIPAAIPELPALSPDDAAYVFFTSGTTAVPRAVLGVHKGLSHFVSWQRETFEVGPGDRVAHLTGLSFDVVLREIFLPLTSGAALSLPPPGGVLEAAVLPWMEGEGITLLHTVPALAQSWLESLPPGVALGALRCVFFAGEPLTDSLVRRWRGAFPGAAVVNLYGPTETTLAKCWHRVEPEPRPGVQPLGRALPQTQALVLAGDRRCGAGEPGEIVIRTPFRTRGYLNAPEENRRRFVPNPFRDDPGDLLYRTGDRGRFTPDGILEILGRLDDQVKVRGVRIDPHEVAAVLAQHPAVAAAVVAGRPDPQGTLCLVAYVVMRGGPVPAAELRAHAARALPPAAVPAAFVVLERLPLTANGKVDRRALPAPQWDAAGDAGFVAPRTPCEEVVAGIWGEVLHRERVGVEESFFDLGGHSLTAVQILSRVRRSLGVDIPVHQLFAAPTVAGIAREAERLLREGAAAVPPLRPAPPEAELPLSFAQERLWFLDQMDPGNPVYNVNAGAGLRGPLDPALLARCLCEVVRRHDALRASFATLDGRARLILHGEAAVDLPLIDLGGLPAGPRETTARCLRAEQVNRAFDLRRAPLLRALLVRLGPAEHELVLTFHHIVADAWSIGLVLRELGVLYEALGCGRPSPLPEPALRYADHAWWQRQWLQGPALAAELAYWRQRLDGAPETIELPLDRPRPPLQSFRGGRVTRQWPASWTAGLRGLARGAEATSFMVLLAGVQALLYRYAGQEDVVVGTPVAGRNRVEQEGLVGLFVNSLVLRTRVGGGRGFGELLRDVRRGVLEAYAHQDLPFEKLVEEVRPERNLAHNPLFQVMLVLQNAPAPERFDSALSLVPLAQEVGTARLDLTLSAMETATGLFLLVDYAADVLDPPTARRLMEHLGALLASAAAEPSSPLASLPLLSAAERQQVLHEWSDTAESFPSGRCLHDLFVAQALADPAAVAVVAGDRQWTYGELDQRSNRLAHHLRDLGVGPDVLAGLAMRRSPEMLMALLAVLKAGGAYVPLDPDLPAERLAQMLADASPAVLVSDEDVAGRLPSTAARTVLLDRDREAIAKRDAGAPPRQATPGNLAYVIYTSGSTGRPVGVMVDHAGVVNTLFWRCREFGLRSADRVLQSIPLSFDPSVWQMFGALMNGARLILPAAEGHKDAEYLVGLMAGQGVTIADFTPSFLRVLLEQPGIGSCRLRHAFIGGEALPVAMRDAFLASFGGELHNLYGPTEASIDATHWPCRRQAPPGVVPIGRPMANKQVLLLDAHSEIVPAGVAGELGIAGSGLARGYLGRPDLTAERFRPHPASAEPGARLYRTGDLARFLPDGAIQFLGRTDHQVKVRGVRIELQEVETVLASHPAVREAVVLARKEGSGGTRLEAYVVTAGSPPPALRELTDHLRSRLPQAMLPSALFLLDALPLTPTDKVDRQALAARGQATRLTSEEPFVAPRTPEEAVLAEIWCEVLGRERVGIEDNFFEAGGDSILSIQIVARAGRRGLRLSPRQVFLHQTIAELAAVAVPVRPGSEAEQGPVAGPVPLTPVQRWFFEQDPAEPWHFNQAIRLELARPLSPGLLAAAVALVVRHHDALRLRFEAGAEGIHQEHAAEDGPFPFAAVDLSALPAGRRQAAAQAAETALQTSLDLVRGPLLRAVLFVAGEGGGGPARLLLVAHHLVVDGVSWRLLLEDLQAACARRLAGLPVELPPKTTSFRGWAERLAEQARSPAVEREAEHWLALLGRPVAPLPVDRPRQGAHNVDAAARTVALSLDPEATAALLQEVPAVHHARVDEALLTALALALSRWTGSRSVLVELEGHGREEELFAGLDLSRTVGWFTCIYPVRLDLGREAGPLAALRAVKEQLRAVPGRGLGFGLLRYLHEGPAAAKLRALPPPEVSFNYLGQFERAPAPDALFRPCGEAAGPARSPLWPRRHLLEVNGLLAGGRLHLQWRYSETLHRRTTIERLAESFQAALRSILDSCRDPQADGRTVSDFQLIRGNQEQLDRLMSKFSRAGERKGQP